jgi:hypothetical protein
MFTKPQFTDPSLFKQEFKRLKFGISKTDYTEQLNALKSYNQALTRLTTQSLELEPFRTDIKTRPCPNFSVLQNYARTLFETLRSGLRCGCGSHAVKLRLENRSQPLDKEDDVHKIPFRVIFTCAIDAGLPSTSTSNFWNWTEADIRCISDKHERVPLSRSTSYVRSPSRTSRQVRFNQAQTQQANSSTTVTVIERQLSMVSAHAPEQIQDLCKAVTAIRLAQPQQNRCIGYLIDSVRRKHGIYPLEHPSNCNQQK